MEGLEGVSQNPEDDGRILVEETGILLRDGGGFVLHRDLGGRIALDLHRLPVDHVEKRVRITGFIISDQRIEVESIAAA